jgi:hypothetical protein
MNGQPRPRPPLPLEFRRPVALTEALEVDDALQTWLYPWASEQERRSAYYDAPKVSIECTEDGRPLRAFQRWFPGCLTTWSRTDHAAHPAYHQVLFDTPYEERDFEDDDDPGDDWKRC